MSDKEVTTQLLARLKRHYIKPGDPMPGGMFMPEVALEGRRADALYVGFFASRGKLLVGHELKVSRADWLHELDLPAKAETWAQHCHAWYVVAPSAAIVHPEELPHGWGLMVPSARTTTRMDIVVKAAVDQTRQPSWAATHALVQKADSLRMAAISEARQKANEETAAEVERRVAAHVALSAPERETERADRAEKLLAEVGDILGFQIVEGARSWGDRVSVDEVHSSFSRWLAADRLTDEGLGYRVSNLRQARESIQEAEKAIDALRKEIA